MPPLPNRTSVEAVIFDAGGVLMLPDLAAGRRALREFGCEPVEADWKRAHYASMAVVDSMDTPDWPALRRHFAALVGVTDDQLDAAAPLIETLVVSTPWMPIPDAARTLRALSDAGYKLGVISNAFGTVEDELRSGGICSITDGQLPRVEIIVDSHIVGFEKPDPRIFHLALDAIGVPAERAIYIGDTVTFDVVGAANAGLHPVHLDPTGNCPGAHSHIDSLGELLNWLV